MKHINSLDDITLEDFEKFVDKVMKSLIDEINKSSTFDELKHKFTEHQNMLIDLRKVQLEARINPDFKEKCIELLRVITDKMFDKEFNFSDSEIPAKIQKALSLTYNGKAIEALGRARTIGKFDPLSRKLKISGVNIFSPDSARNIGVGTAKIFRYGAIEFTKLNPPNTPSDKLKLRVLLDLNDYALANGVDITSSDDMKNFRRKLRNELEKLKIAGPSWEEPIKGKKKSYGGINYIGQYNIKGDTIMIEFTLGIAEYLVSLPVLPYPRALFSLEDRYANAYAIGETMLIHYGIDNNVIRGTYGRLKVETLLQYTSYPSYDELQAHKWSWRDYVKEPFEECLDRLYQCGFIKDWGYCHEGGIELTDEEVKNIKSYREFISLLVWYELNDYEDEQTRFKAITAKREEKKKKLEAKNKKRKKVDNN